MTELYNKTFLAIDYGTVRIGLAKSDPMGVIASALDTIVVKSKADAAQKIKPILEEYQPNAVVIGYPLMPSGDISDKCRQVDNFIKLLAEMYAGPIHRVDERYSSVEATRIIHAHGKKVGSDKKRVDRLAAVIILQRFLDELPS